MNTWTLRRNVHRFLSGAAYWARLVAGLGLVVLAGRFAILVGGHIDDFLEKREASTAPPPRTSRTVPSVAGPPSAALTATTPAATSAASAPPRAATPTANAAATAPSAPPVPKGPPEVRSLLVDLGPPRSEVFVNTRRLGETPYAGQWTCRAGEILRVQIIPKRGVPVERTLICGGTTMSVH